MAKRTQDHTNLKKKGGNPVNDTNRATTETARRWWEKSGMECANAIAATYQFLQQNQTALMKQRVISARLYGNQSMMGSGGQAYARLMASQSAVKDRVTFNATQSILDTLVSRIGEDKPRPYYLTSGGSYREQRKAKTLNRFTEGVFYETKTYDKGMEVFRDAGIWGDGFMKVFPRAGKLQHERVVCAELWVDEVEAMYGAPRRLLHVKDVDRSELEGYFKDDKEAVKVIQGASRSPESAQARGVNNADMVQVAEAWDLAVESEDGDLIPGKHAIAIIADGSGAGMLLEPEDWEYPFFPFAHLPWRKRPIGFWSQGECEALQGEQLELNKELWFIQRSMQLAGFLKVLIKQGTKISTEHLNNEIGGVIEYTGEVPQFYCPEPINGVYFENVNRIIERMYQQSGASQLSAAAKKPAGLNSGVAIREAQDIESERHRALARAYNNFFLDVAALDMAFAHEAKGYKVRVPQRNSFEQIDVSKLGKLKGEEFVLQCFPVSKLPRDPAGRLQTIQEYIQAGFMTPRQGRRALDFPDLDTIESLANAQEDGIQKALDDIVDEGEYAPPEPTTDLDLAKEMAVEYIERFRQSDLEPDRMDMLRFWNAQVDEMKARAQQGAQMLAMQQQPQLGTPQAVPQRAPASDLLPQSNS